MQVLFIIEYFWNIWLTLLKSTIKVLNLFSYITLRKKTFDKYESAIKEKTQKSLHSELHKREALTQYCWGLGGTVSPPAGPGLSPGGGKAPRKFRVFSSKNTLDWLILSQFLPLIL